MTTKSPAFIGVVSVVCASVAAAVISSSIASMENTSDSALVTKTEVANLERRVTKTENGFTKDHDTLTRLDTHVDLLRKQVQGNEDKLDALLNHFAIPAPPPPNLGD